jgi:hypothetical protein
MNEVARINEVWILEAGEADEGGNVLGIYADRDLARDDFIAEAVKMCDGFGERAPDLSERRENGSLRVEVHCDWLTLEPHPVVTAPRLPRTDAQWDFRPAGSRLRAGARVIDVQVPALPDGGQKPVPPGETAQVDQLMARQNANLDRMAAVIRRQMAERGTAQARVNTALAVTRMPEVGARVLLIAALCRLASQDPEDSP